MALNGTVSVYGKAAAESRNTKKLRNPFLRLKAGRRN